jgi:pyruvate formate lyase activating enzyme
VSNGNATPQVLDYLRPHLDCYKVDLKSFDDRHYRQLGGRLAPILDSIQRLHDLGVWLEVVTLLVPGFNDDPGEIAALTTFLAGVSPDIPWHVTAFHSDYKMADRDGTTARQLVDAADVGRAHGLRYVYAGNRPGQVGELEDTRCATCNRTLVARQGYLIKAIAIDDDGRCASCRASVPGIWKGGPATATRPRLSGIVRLWAD